MRQPLDGFADRIIRNNETSEFIAGLVEKGVSLEHLYNILDDLRGVVVHRARTLEGH